MKTLKACVCDDDSAMLPTYAASVKGCFQGYGVSCDVDFFSSTQGVRARLSEYGYDVIFLDIDMPREDGISFAQELRKLDSPIPVIFVSAREDKMYDTFAVRPFGFVRKSHFLNDLSETVRLFLEANPSITEDNVLFSTSKGDFSVSAKQIVFIESYQHNQYVILKDLPKLEIHSSMDNVEKLLADKGFIRVHKSYIVNYRYINRITEGEIILSTGDKLPLSRHKKADVKALWLEYGTKNGFTYIEDQ